MPTLQPGGRYRANTQNNESLRLSMTDARGHAERVGADKVIE
jgi:hypothetical protein